MAIDPSAFALSTIQVVIRTLSPLAYDLLAEYGLIKKRRPAVEIQVEDRLSTAASALQDASAFLTKMQKTVSEQKTLIESLKAEHTHYKSLAAVEREKAETVLAAVNETVNAGAKRERWVGFGLGLVGNFIFFLLGVLAADKALGQWVQAGWNLLWNMFHK